MGDTGQQSENGRSRRRIALWACLGVVGSLCIAAGLYLYYSANPVVARYRELARFYSSRKEVKAFLTSFGPYAPIPFFVLQALQVVFAPVPGEATGFLGGYVFGTWLGFLYSSIGLTLASDVLDAVFLQDTTERWLARLRHQLPAAPVNDLPQALENPYVHSIGMVRPLPHPRMPGFRALANPTKLDGRRLPLATAPALGAHTEEVLAGLGYDAAGIERLRGEGAL